MDNNRDFSEQINILLAIVIGEDMFYLEDNLSLQKSIDEYVNSIFDIVIENLEPWKRFLCGLSHLFDKYLLKDFSLGLDKENRTIIFKGEEQVGMTKLLYKKRKRR